MQDAGELLKTLRLQAGFGLRRFAELIGMQPSNLSAIEHGRRPFPDDHEKVRGIADALGLVEGSDEWGEFFDAARGPGQLPADLTEFADRELVPVLLRTVKNRDLTDDEIRRLIDEFQSGKGGSGDPGKASDLHGQAT
ncbi:MAG: helix-turn-helix transcriptional regulator [Planctomycetaceae bacterium]|nr:helix-turn-helix transcriptional regulator [Planctomycetaceae bacterium]